MDKNDTYDGFFSFVRKIRIHSFHTFNSMQFSCYDHYISTCQLVWLLLLLLFVSGTYNQNTHLYDIETLEYVKVLTGHIGIINSILPSPSGRFLFTASYDHTIQVTTCTRIFTCIRSFTTIFAIIDLSFQLVKCFFVSQITNVLFFFLFFKFSSSLPQKY